MGSTEYCLLNSFVTDTPYSGNQVAVVFLENNDERFKDERWLQGIAHNFNYPATSFLVPVTEEGPELEYDLRWFAEGELPFCGHGTLGASYAIFDKFSDAQVIKYNAKPGQIIARKAEGGVELSLPVIPIDKDQPDPQPIIDQITRMTSFSDEDVVNIATFTWTGLSIIVELKSSVDLAKAEIDGRALAETGARMIIFTQMAESQSGEALNINSRVFLPDAASVEDPATGSAHATLTGYYSTYPSPLSRLPPAVSRRENRSFDINATQLSRRGGAMKTRYEKGRAIITAKADMWGRGTLE